MRVLVKAPQAKDVQYLFRTPREKTLSHPISLATFSKHLLVRPVFVARVPLSPKQSRFGDVRFSALAATEHGQELALLDLLLGLLLK